MSLSRTVFGSKFQIVAVQQNACFAIVVLVNGQHSGVEWPIVVTDCGRPQSESRYPSHMNQTNSCCGDNHDDN